ncbi:DUF4136 domain-containing protein [Shewanella sp. JM162201]|uniref:DUF4136 domain-containing protein n=1 Tax=Shewanella jiangmenensis TaxID=2837387 RepID=A0ABS5V139_9GAMM|nr:DUF4136 domain-containing protein [Shewanella jiangmenensis]MBT1443615.1 DUF4136 domain-containing protein [Shewanella jiangmenensis]
MKRMLLIFTLLLLGACQSGPKTDYDPKVNFAAMQTFTLLSPAQTSDPLSSERIRAAIGDSLRAKGMREINGQNNGQTNSNDNSDPTSSADIKVTWAFETGSKPSNSGLSIGLGSGSWGHSGGIGVGTSIGIPIGGDTLYQLIQIDVLSAAGDKLLWRGSDGFEFSDGGDNKAKATKETVDKILASFPPKAGS